MYSKERRLIKGRPTRGSVKLSKADQPWSNTFEGKEILLNEGMEQY